jgi:hypothetical protein
MPNRILRPWLDSEAVNSLDNAAEVFFVRLIMAADDFGRFYGSPQILRAYLYPLKDVRVSDISRLIAACVKAGLIVDYEVAGKRYVQINKFGQRMRTMKSKFPPPKNDGHMTVNCQTDDGQLSDICQSYDGHMTATRRETRDENIKYSDKSSYFSLEPEIDSGNRGKQMEKISFDYEGDCKFHGIDDETMERWREAYPALDVDYEILSAGSWLDANRKNRKYDIKRFLVGWLKRAQDRAKTQTYNNRDTKDYTGL